ncbi:MAG: AAA family ATPase [Gammaproteobacteria bacterium]|nr:AAA family ATPase [Gammaproteobacteria bacterium]
MDDPILQSLLQALAVSPDNLPLRLMIVRHCLKADRTADALEHARALQPEQLEQDEDRLLLAQLYLDQNQPQTALPFCTGKLPRQALLRAKALLALGQNAQAQDAYRAAIGQDKSLEDAAFARQLDIQEGDGRPKLRVVANDNTNVTEIRRLLAPEEAPIRFADVGGLEDVKKQIHKRIILPFQKPSLFQRFRKRVGGGILLYGPPGCGKTLLARATAGECNARFLNVELSDILDMYIGESEKKLHAIFELARQQAPAVIFFDEVEALGGKRQYSRESTSSKLVSQFLSELDGFSRNNEGVLILASTNVPWALDSAFLRPGRFDRLVFIPPPDLPARRSILHLLLQGRPVEDRIDLDFLARNSGGFSGADLKNLVETAIDFAIEATMQEGNEVPVSDAHLKEALREVRPTTLEWLTSARNYAKYANESGLYNDVLDFLNKHGKG